MKLKFLAASIVLFWVCALIAGRVFADTTSSINATVKISICGNSIVEGGEDCDGTNLNNKGCSDISGFSGGILSCDISCAFDTSKCVKATIIPTVAPPPVATSPTSAYKSEENITATVIPIPTAEGVLLKNLPILVQLFGDQKSGTIQKVQLRTVLLDWVSAWKQSVAPSVANSAKKTAIPTCDTDNDGSCDIRDFSVLLFYAR